MTLFVSLSVLFWLLIAAVLYQRLYRTKKTEQVPVIISVVLLIPLTVMLYLAIGSPAFIEPAVRQAEPPMMVTQQDIDRMIAGLEQRLAGDTEDVEGLAMLARSYKVKGQYQQSIDTYQRLLALQPDNIDVMLSLIEVLVTVDGDKVSGKALELVERILTLNQNQPQALWLAGLAAAQRQQRQAALAFWQRLLPLLEGQPQQQDLTILIEQLVKPL
jgi:cytochrome c-type biogenesis protein CcmH